MEVAVTACPPPAPRGPRGGGGGDGGAGSDGGLDGGGAGETARIMGPGARRGRSSAEASPHPAHTILYSALYCV